MSEQRSQEWFKEREDRVTASRVGAILGVDPNANPADVMRMMARQYQGAESEFPQGEFVDEVIFAYGRHHEKGAKIDYTMETGSIIKECGFTTFDNWLGASPDGEVGDEGLVEIKCPYGIRKGGDFKSINQLHHYYAQIQIQLYVTGRKWCDFYQWSQHGTKLEKVWMNQDYLDITLPKLKAFYNFYLTERDNLRYVDEKKRPEKNTPEARQLVAEHDDNNAAIKKLEERQKEILDNLVVMAGGKDASFDGRKLTKVERAGSIAYAKLVKDKLPNIDVEPYRGKSSEYWRLT
jgi:putative phage-type endonuclease